MKRTLDQDLTDSGTQGKERAVIAKQLLNLKVVKNVLSGKTM